MRVAELYEKAGVVHDHSDCVLCNTSTKVMDIRRPRNEFDRLMIAIRNANAMFRIIQGKRIEVKEG